LYIVIPTLGSVGDVQLFIALGVRLRAAGHRVRLATHADFEEPVRSRGLDFFAIEGSSRAYHNLHAGHKMMNAGSNPFEFLRHFGRLRQPLIHQLVARTHQASQNADAMVVSGSAFTIGHCVAEKLGLPIFAAHLLPMGLSRFIPNGLFPSLPSWLPLRSVYNFMTHVFVGEYLWQLLRNSINKARQEILGLPPYPVLGPLHLSRGRHTFHAYSPSVVTKPPDWDECEHLTGFWFVETDPGWRPPSELVDFLDAGPPPVYVGFGSMGLMRMPDQSQEQVTDMVVEALTRTRQRGVLCACWGRFGEMQKSDRVFHLESAPHSWLFPRMAAVVHHGGAGTTAAGLRAGLPSVIVPFMADQPFWGQRIFELGVGPKPIPRKLLSVDRLTGAIRTAVSDASMRARATELGQKIRSEKGVDRALEVIEAQLAGVRTATYPARAIHMPIATGRRAAGWMRPASVATQAF
jgi:UDP:flavonoid glycosyltransferase YjiC (YdhE family)